MGRQELNLSILDKYVWNMLYNYLRLLEQVLSNSKTWLSLEPREDFGSNYVFQKRLFLIALCMMQTRQKVFFGNSFQKINFKNLKNKS